MSSLYNAPIRSVCSLPQPEGLDAHYRSQLQLQIWGQMYIRLEEDIKAMGEHLTAQLKECMDFAATLEPIFKYVRLFYS